MSAPGETTIRFIEMLLNESTALLVRHGETQTDAYKMACEFVLSYARQQTGLGSLYFRKDPKFEAQIKRELIRSEFRAGKTVFELSDKHKLTTVRIYQILRQQETELAETDTSLKAPLMIEAARMLLKAGIEKKDAASAARGLVAVVLARFSGILIPMSPPNQIEIVIKNIEIIRNYRAGKSLASLAARFNLMEDEIKNIIDRYPVSRLPWAAGSFLGSGRLPLPQEFSVWR